MDLEKLPPDDELEGRHLLVVLHALMLRDRAPSGMEGRVAIGVRTKERDLWWKAELGMTPGSEFVDGRPSDVDGSLLLGEVEAETILKTGSIPEKPKLILVRGDRELLTRFVKRYTGRQNMVSLRAGGAPSAPSAKKTRKKKSRGGPAV